MSTSKVSTFQAARSVFEQKKDQSRIAPGNATVAEKKLTPFQQARLRFDQQGKIDEQIKKTNVWKGKPTALTTAPVAAQTAPVAKFTEAAKPKPAIVRTGSIKNNPFLKDSNTTAAFQKKATDAVPEEKKPTIERMPSRNRVSEMKESFDKNKVTIVDTTKRNYTPEQHRDQAKQQNFSSAKQRFQQQCERERAHKSTKEQDTKPTLTRINSITSTPSQPSTPIATKPIESSIPQLSKDEDLTNAPPAAHVVEEVAQVQAEQPATPATEASPAVSASMDDDEYEPNYHEEDQGTPTFVPFKQVTGHEAPEHKQMTDANDQNMSVY